MYRIKFRQIELLYFLQGSDGVLDVDIIVMISIVIGKEYRKWKCIMFM